MEVNFLQAALIYFFNGVTLEFGDEVFCIAYDYFGYSSQASCREALLSVIYVGAEKYTYISIISAILGYALSPMMFIYVALKGKPQTAGQIFSAVLTVELIEGTISVAGQMATDGDFSTAIISLPLSLAVGSIRAIVLSFLFEWNKSDLFKFQVVALACLVLGTFFYVLDFDKFFTRSPTVQPQPEAHQPERQQEKQKTGELIEAPYVVSAICIVNRSNTNIVNYQIRRYSGKLSNHEIVKPRIRIHHTASPTYRKKTMPFTIILPKANGASYSETINAQVFPLSESDVPNIEKVLYATRDTCESWFPKVYIYENQGGYYLSY